MGMKLYDQHLHSHYSFDCETDPRDNVLAAIDRGLAGLTFTEHFDTHAEEWSGCRYDDEVYSRAIARLRDEFGQRIFIGKGIEVCYQPQRMDFILDFLSGHRFDLVILSVHWAAGRRLYRREEWQDLDVGTGTRLYLEAVLDAARTCRDLRQRHGRRCFDVLGHLDFVKRYTQRFFDDTRVDEHGDLLDGILGTCLEADLVPEVNTSTLRNGMGEPMPGAATVRRFATLGGEAMSVGSDAHSTDWIAGGFDAAIEIFRNAGIEHQAVFMNRELHTLPWPEAQPRPASGDAQVDLT
ncbi:MAG TPA: histidinol-phosphatase HisJ family protein [Phycisphaerae bacterium]|nr:histidinol-phosphatase HisJ family protein [Phycisphaerae bacterium]